MEAIAASSLKKLRQFSPQHLTNTAWAFAELFFWHEPLMHAIASEASRRIRELRFGDGHTLVWSLEKGLPFCQAWSIFERYLEGGLATDVLDVGIFLTSVEAMRSARFERHIWYLIGARTPVRRDVQEIIAGVNFGERDPSAWIGKESPGLAGAQVARHGGHAQHKLAMLVQHVEAVLHRSERVAAAILEAIVEFSGKKFNYWLKVAADVKATLIDYVVKRSDAAHHRVRVELGAYVGYSSLRLSGAVGPCDDWRVLSLEVDPLHVCIARHLLNLGERAGFGEVRSGQVRDLIPRIVDELGEASLGLVFMDHKGTRFQDEIRIFECQRMPTSQMDIITDNVLHPGAPVYLWEESRPGSARLAAVWSLPEFGGEGCIEDWMAFERYEPRHLRSTARLAFL
eukprot:gnl/TRDRNA2_/TRDRNA2_166792_c1_seq1.p1 gnl/TRDRNA2_/TRDRNA2_166792_c1~~gnl/TRDRNA2_/TRDRNA2_166792_c1_seq1.p1  ORF type:complete len:406 (+),score=52.68 gnl/TRDRNA2_/TRDRNA2_166792_c1_seq1:23-1219(+)